MSFIGTRLQGWRKIFVIQLQRIQAVMREILIMSVPRLDTKVSYHLLPMTFMRLSRLCFVECDVQAPSLGGRILTVKVEVVIHTNKKPPLNASGSLPIRRGGEGPVPVHEGRSKWVVCA